ncbi:MAG: hypothetical protein KF901_19455 [Myxococcales bacterium]|nr:hypothetical protein [Myxococcales bacterium]
MRSETWKNARHVLLAAGWLMAACGGSSMTPGPDDGGMPGDGGFGHDGAPPMSDFDPSQTYEGEGTACRMSLQCGDRQLCVRGECMRHERIDRETAEFGLMRQAEADDAPDADVFSARAAVAGQGAWIFTSVVVPGRDQASLVSLESFDEQGCLVTRVEREWRAAWLPNVDCLGVDANERGELFVAAASLEDGGPVVVRLDEALHEVARVEPSREMLTRSISPLGPEARFGGATSVLVDGDDVLFAVGVFSRDALEHDATVVFRMTPGGVRMAREQPIDGGRGWLVRDAEHVSVVTTVWDWEDGSTRWPRQRDGDHRILVTEVVGDESNEIYRGPAMAATYMRPSATDWWVVIGDPRCEIPVYHMGRRVEDRFGQSSSMQRCRENMFEVWAGPPNRSRPSELGSGFLAWDGSRVELFELGPRGVVDGDDGDEWVFPGIRSMDGDLISGERDVWISVSGCTLINLYGAGLAGLCPEQGAKAIEVVAEVRP